jgi:galactose-1-phosphate uridylyltransferase
MTLQAFLDDLDIASNLANRTNGETAYKAGDGIYFTGKSIEHVKAKIAGLIKSASLGTTNSKYNRFMDNLWYTMNDRDAKESEREKAKRTYKWFAQHVNDKAGHYKKFRTEYDQPGWDAFNNMIDPISDRISRRGSIF